MSQDFFDPELFADFINEAKEHLETIEPNLLELEKAPDNLALLNDIFRPMHSLKGASGFLGLNRINQLAHKSENILDELRKGTMVVTPEIMDVILSSTDALRQMVENLEATNSEGDVEIDHIIAQIEAIMNGEAAAPAAEAAPAEAPAAEAAPAEEAAPAAEAAEPAAAAEAPSAAPAAEAPAAVSPEAAGSEEAPGMSSKEWVASLPDKQEYALNAFGEGHLKDFIDESLEITGNLNDGLLQLEDGDGQGDLVNDLFRFFHNLKGNSGIIGYNELNALTHEAETLLNNVRQGKMSPSHELIDLLLLVVDVMETLVGRIDVASGKTRPFDTEPILTQLKKAVAGEEIALPPALIAAQKGGKGGETGDGKPVDVVTPVIIPMGAEGDDLDAFQATIKQQFEIINAALATLRKDGSHKDSEDALFRCLTAIKNASSFVGFNDVKEYAERTAGIVDQGRSQGIDFSLMVDLISQETAIIEEMATAAIKKKRESAPAAPEAAASEPAAPAAESEKVAPAAAPAAKPAAPAASAAAGVPSSARSMGRAGTTR
ncbi:Hpt domain-containing protein [uncultured Desulfovibrio sp.]|uniref:Hpt domain-containing protein n=1 Tax=uncultured Desulfovibrio sp. TaxID=167968 RepID=UPI002624D0C4|nr:Hpt domain-containing protein [uncultured Desulfovibrio sp.]